MSTKKIDDNKFEVIYEDDDCVQIFTYNHKISKNGPISSEIKWKTGKYPVEKKVMSDHIPKKSKRNKST
jgi:hypothetical protein